MKTHYIRYTNKQYSIREDGVVFINYRIKRITNTRKDKIKCNDKLTVLKGNCVDIKIKHKVKRSSINNLLFNHFGFKLCLNCAKRFIPNISKVKCDKCRIEAKKESANKYAREWYKNNTKLAREIANKNTKDLTDTYISKCLNVPANILPQEVIESKRQQLLLHRTIKQSNYEHSN